MWRMRTRNFFSRVIMSSKYCIELHDSSNANLLQNVLARIRNNKCRWFKSLYSIDVKRIQWFKSLYSFDINSRLHLVIIIWTLPLWNMRSEILLKLEWNLRGINTRQNNRWMLGIRKSIALLKMWTRICSFLIKWRLF